MELLREFHFVKLGLPLCSMGLLWGLPQCLVWKSLYNPQKLPFASWKSLYHQKIWNSHVRYVEASHLLWDFITARSESISFQFNIGARYIIENICFCTL